MTWANLHRVRTVWNTILILSGQEPGKYTDIQSMNEKKKQRGKRRKKNLRLYVQSWPYVLALTNVVFCKVFWFSNRGFFFTFFYIILEYNKAHFIFEE